jgi:DNA (cytosine-5)-methyltransferase 1
MKLNSIDLFSGCGGLTEGMHQANFITKLAFEIDVIASNTYKLNHPDTIVINKDIRQVSTNEIEQNLNGQEIHLLAGCPPCQGFSSIRRLNKKNVKDKRNNLLNEYLRIVKALRPLTIMMENVPALQKYYLFKDMVRELKSIGYFIDFDVVNVKKYGVPQSRKRFVMVGSLLGEINIAEPTGELATVRDTIGKMEPTSKTKDDLHKIFPKHTAKVMERIKKTPKNGGSWKDLPKRYILNCHKGKNVGFNDIYGRLRWDDCSTTITGGCLNPSKGRFLHPTKNRTITAREASLLQSFPPDYKFPKGISRTSLALLIGNALPPKFSFIQSENIKKHLYKHLLKQEN